MNACAAPAKVWAVPRRRGLRPRLLVSDGRILVDDAILRAPLEEADRRGAIGALILGARNLRAPDLLSLLPPRSANAHDCVRCTGSGWWALPGETKPAGAKILCPDCSGLGWAG